MRKHPSHRRWVATAAIATLLFTGHTLAAPSLENLPGCRGSIDAMAQAACRLRTDHGLFERTSMWQSFGHPGEQIDGGVGPAWHAPTMTVRGFTPLGTTYYGGDVSYTVQFNAGLTQVEGGALGKLRVNFWLGDDQGRHRLDLGEKKATFGGDTAGTFRFTVPGQNVGFDPNFLYVDIHSEERVSTPGGHEMWMEGGSVSIQNVHVSVQPTAAN
ncbi:hypothetical protein [Dyella sp. 333MFSha]|uniref:hypothetical protein n=1 Tax=Dyella sp. 333MFSha TaxID=1798240 RepID=UPI000889A335|nr:hypothetical protein [Dyella sp. 333MFSha]SDG81070.1 hypothetical protein SAMN04515659_3591 [Dyella sp. 333MFSha]